MKNRVFSVILPILLLFLSACSSPERSVSRFQKQLNARQATALRYCEDVVRALGSNSFDSVRVATQNTDGILFYIFSTEGMVYWSDNWLSGQGIMYPKYDRWFYYHFENAETVCRWRECGEYKILTIIPVKYAYTLENELLHNTFIEPFRLPKNYQIRQSKPKGSMPVVDSEGNYLFSIIVTDLKDEPAVEEHRLADSFSYQAVLETGEQRTHVNIHFFIIASLIFLVCLLCMGVYGIWRSRGLSNMRLSVKYQYLIVSMLLVLFACVFLVAVKYVRERYLDRQQSELQHKAKYLQKSLQDLYYWNMNLTARNTPGLNVDLRDLCFSYETDINVYDMEGNLVGSSSPAVFEKGIKSTHIHPEPFFAKNCTMVREEQLGEMKYMAAYTELFNGNYVQIGYIEVPYYVAADERHMAVDDFLQKLLPSYLTVMMLAILVALILSRGITRQLMEVSEALKQVRVGKRNRHLQYDHKDEVGDIVEEYNKMVDQLEESTERLAKSEREDAWRTMARQVAHEINNTLTPMKLNIQMLQMLKAKHQDERFNQKFDSTTNTLLDTLDGLSNIATSFSTFAKLPEQHPENVDIAAKLFSVIGLFRENAEGVPVRYVGAEYGVFAMADNAQINQVFTNLIKNALQAINGAPGGDIIVILKDLSDSVEISVSDNGCGIPEEAQPRIFTPYFTTKTTGTGLGLGISKNIVEGCGGTIRFKTSKKGTQFFVTLRKESKNDK